MQSGKIRIKRSSIQRLLGEVDSGRFAIPNLQREFVWNGPKAAKLLDSIFRGMPIGMALIWETPKSDRLRLRQKYHVLPPFNRKNPKVWFLIDGQQRVSVLHHIRQGDQLENSRRQVIDFSRIVLSLTDEEDGQQIRYRRTIPGEHIALSDLLASGWRKKMFGLGRRKLARAEKCRRRVLGYPFYKMFINGDLEDVRECFLRINTQGMKIATADAIFTQAEALNLRDVAHEVRQHLDEAFDDLPDAPILFLLSAIHGNSDPRGRAVESTIRKLNREALEDHRRAREITKEWHKIGPSVGKAADYLRLNFKVLNREFLASDYILSMLAYFLLRNGHGPSRRQAQEIKRWFWATSVGTRYSGRDFNRCVPDDLEFFEALARRRRPPKFQYLPQVEPVDVRKAQYASRAGITSAVYCMLLDRRPVALLDKGINEIPLDRYSTRANRKDRHHIFPQQAMANEKIPARLYNSIGNVCLLVAEENQKIGFKRPRAYLKEIRNGGRHFSRKMRRHLVPVEDASGVWDHNIKRGFRRFLEDRTELICGALEEQAGIQLFRKDRRRVR